jgi:TolB-like protein
MQVLVALARRAGHPVTRDELLNEVWSDTVVGDEVLSRAISLLRTALGDERTNPRFIRTLPRLGYELVAAVEPLTPPATPKRRLVLLFAAAGLLIAVVVAALLVSNRERSPITVAVIPFTSPNMGSNGALLAEALADSLISAMTRSPELAVKSRHSSFLIRDTAMDVQDIGDRLDADYLIEGVLNPDPDGVRLTLSLVDSDSGQSLWTDQIKGSADAAADLQERSLAALSTTLVQRFGIAALHDQTDAVAPNTEAYRRYLEARYQWSLRGEQRIRRAIALLEEAIELEPSFARAHLALAQSLAVEPFYTDMPVPPSFALARAQSDIARDLDPALGPEADALEGFMLISEQRWDEAHDTLAASLAAEPQNPLAHYWQSRLLSKLGRYEAALEEIQTSARLDPLSAVINDRLAIAYLFVNRNADAERQYAVAAELGFLESTQVKPYVWLAVRQRRFGDIESTLLKIGSSPTWVHAFVTALEDPASREEASLTIDDAISNGEIDRAYWFGIWVLLGDADRAVRDFDHGYKTQDIELLWAKESAFLRADPRFPDLLERVNLSQLTP